MSKITTIVFDMYGVIIEESKGKFIPYVYEHIPGIKRDTIVENFTAAGLGEIDCRTFFHKLGFSGDYHHYRDEYLKNYLTLDCNFHLCATALRQRFDLMLLSNDLSEWNEFLMKYHRIDYLIDKTVISGDVGYRKPDRRIYELLLERYRKTAEECIFIDNSVRNLETASLMGMRVILFNRDKVEYRGNTVDGFGELSAMINSIISDLQTEI